MFKKSCKKLTHSGCHFCHGELKENVALRKIQNYLIKNIVIPSPINVAQLSHHPFILSSRRPVVPSPIYPVAQLSHRPVVLSPSWRRPVSVWYLFSPLNGDHRTIDTVMKWRENEIFESLWESTGGKCRGLGRAVVQILSNFIRKTLQNPLNCPILVRFFACDSQIDLLTRPNWHIQLFDSSCKAMSTVGHFTATNPAVS